MVQHRFTRLFSELRNLCYNDRLRTLGLWSLEERRNRAYLLEAVFENTYFTFFRFQKHDFLRFFWNDVSKSRKMPYRKHQEILASKLPNVMGTYRHLSHTVFSCLVSCVHTSEQGVWCWWPEGLRFKTFLNLFYVFFSKSKNMSFYVFWVVAHVFSNNGWRCSSWSQEYPPYPCRPSSIATWITEQEATHGNFQRIDRCKLDNRKYFFSERVVNRWNSLSHEDVD